MSQNTEKGVVFILALQLFLAGSRVLSMQVCPCVLDLAFLLDDSGSIQRQGFTYIKEFVGNLTDYFAVSPGGTHIGVVKFSNGVSVEVSFEPSRQNPSSVKDRVDAMQYTGGSATLVDLGLQETYTKLFVKGGRPAHQTTRVLLVATDGISSRGVRSTATKAKQLKDFGVIVVAMGIGQYVNSKELKALASEPDDVYRIPSTKTLASKAVREEFALTLCAAARRQGVMISRILPKQAVVGHVIARLNTIDDMECAQKCRRNKRCFSFNYSVQLGTCELNSAQASAVPEQVVSNSRWTYYELFG